ncbi:hypothetical protein AB1Y20_009487 [Prymnesium parvum]|uniref:Protein xylosyltransferase n=1 Tax=Prymnesium parvum TaxID=97485 RepID=A0AB34K0U4_PRYPA
MRLLARLDASGDGWVRLFTPTAPTPLAGVWVELHACVPPPDAPLASPDQCSELAVFGGSGGAAEASGWMVSAAYAFGHGVHALCPTGTCSPVASDGALLTELSVAVPRLERRTVVCLTGGALFPAAAGARAVEVGRSCTPALGRAEGNASRRARGVAFVKTYKTGSSTLGSLLHRYADARGLDVAVNAKALRGSRSLERWLRKGTMPKPNECLFEFHRFQPCGRAWTEAQEAAGLPPKPLQLVVDHSRWQPLDELLEERRRGGGGGGVEAAACRSFVRRMRDVKGVARALFLQEEAATELRHCVDATAAAQRGRALKAPLAYREAVPEGLLLTAMRWPVGRFMSALEQFSLPQQTGVPCRRTRAARGGACFGQTCERDFHFSWVCLNTSVPRQGMLAAFVRCLFHKASAAKRREAMLADLAATRAAAPPPSAAAAAAMSQLVAQLEAARGGGGGGGRGWRAARPAACGSRARREMPPTFRFAQESVAHTLGFPAEPRPRADTFGRMAERRDFGALAFAWLGALARSVDLVVLAEHFDQSLLLLGREAAMPHQQLVYLSQKRRKTTPPPGGGGGGGGSGGGGESPAAAAAVSPARLANVSAWPSAADLARPEAAWLWPHELDAALRGNWLDSLAYMYFNATLWRRIDAAWPGADGRADFARELAAFRTLRAEVKAKCAECDAEGAARCVAAARARPSGVTPHLCWTLRQDTRSWSEHFFMRTALRFDAVAAMRGGDAAQDGAVRGRAASGMRSGNVQWWRCGNHRAVSESCRVIPNRPGSVARYSAWDCLCSWQ